ncbi:MAG TPA: hypothetical protein VFR76_07605, partial [Verrucomicrobiae bacterium]|nr:hypothetical protein [Verrucomicrobiae bacterium]
MGELNHKSQATSHESRLKLHFSRFTIHDSRFTFHVSRITFQVARNSLRERILPQPKHLYRPARLTDVVLLQHQQLIAVHEESSIGVVELECWNIGVLSSLHRSN